MSLPIRPSSHGQHLPAAPNVHVPLPAPPPMPSMPAAPMGPSRGPDEVDPLLDLAFLRQMAGFPWRCVRRHPRVTAAVAVLTLALVAVAAVVMPKTYVVSTSILAQRNVVMPALNNPRRTVPSESDAPTKLASETVLQRDNLLQIIRETNLMARIDRLRSPLGRLKDAVKRVVSRPPTDDDRREMLVEFLKQRLWVATSDGQDGTVTIGIAWPDAPSGLAVVQAAQENFFQDRHATEVSRIGESIAIIERYVAQARGEMDSTLKVLNIHAPRATAAASPTPRSAPLVSPEVAGLRATLAAKRAALQDLTDSRARRLADLQSQLTELRKTYGPAHPDVRAMERTIASVSGDTPQLVSLRAEEKSIVERLAALGAPESPTPDPTPSEPMLARAALERLAHSDLVSDPQAAYAQAQLKMSIDKYTDLLDRLQSAHIELETARAAFKYRYNVVNPAQLPKAPVKPKIPVLIVGGLFLAVALSVFSAIVLDLMSGRVIERWQVERQLKLPVLGEVTPL
jgi:uncharacterized protein involved in exopolysaccharide biosynthesis